MQGNIIINLPQHIDWAWSLPKKTYSPSISMSKELLSLLLGKETVCKHKLNLSLKFTHILVWLWKFKSSPMIVCELKLNFSLKFRHILDWLWLINRSNQQSN